MDEVLFSSKKHDWETPDWLFDELDAEFHFTLDAAASDNNAKCDLYCTEESDGLTTSWTGHTVFVNPPYSNVAAWVEKAWQEYTRGATVVMLLPARTDTRYFHRWIYHRSEIRFLKGRLKFSGSKNSAPFPSMIVIFRGL